MTNQYKIITTYVPAKNRQAGKRTNGQTHNKSSTEKVIPCLLSYDYAASNTHTHAHILSFIHFIHISLKFM